MIPKPEVVSHVEQREMIFVQDSEDSEAFPGSLSGKGCLKWVLWVKRLVVLYGAAHTRDHCGGEGAMPHCTLFGLSVHIRVLEKAVGKVLRSRLVLRKEEKTGKRTTREERGKQRLKTLNNNDWYI